MFCRVLSAAGRYDEGTALGEGGTCGGVATRSSLATPAPGEPALVATYFPDALQRVNPQVKRPLVVVIPGGAYERVSAREGEPVALQMVARGMAACVLSYSCAPARYPEALVQVARAVAFLRRNAGLFHVDPHRIVLCGFSAGGHLALDLGCEWNDPKLAELAGERCEDMRPDALVLGYPVVTSGEFAHRPSIQNLTGGEPGLVERVSLEHRVGPQVPPTFMFHTLEDEVVPVENSLMLAAALRRAGVSFSLRVFPYGPHGLSLATRETAHEEGIGAGASQVQPLVQCWPDLAADWVRTL